MDAPHLVLVQDVVTHLIDYMGGSGKEDNVRDAKRAIVEAMRDLANDHRWSYYYTIGRIATSEPYRDGSVAYDHTGGAAERLLTLDGGAWPSWAAYGTVRIGGIDYEVASRISDSDIQLEISSNPGGDLPSGTTYSLYRDTYPLPVDFVSMTELRGENWLALDYVPAREWLAMRRSRTAAGGPPRYYSIVGSPDFTGSMTVRLHPSPDQAKTLDYVYYRRPRAPRVQQYAQGSVTTVAGSTVVSGSGTGWTEKVAGAGIRISGTSKDAPTDFVGKNPAAFEGVVVAFVNSVQLVVDNPVPETLVNVKYEISDLIDVEEGVMMNAFLRCCEKHLANVRIMKDKPNATALYEHALYHAKSADSRNIAEKVAGAGRASIRSLVRHGLPGPDIG